VHCLTGIGPADQSLLLPSNDQVLPDGHGKLHTGDIPHRALAILADFDVDIKNSFQALGLGMACMPVLQEPELVIAL